MRLLKTIGGYLKGRLFLPESTLVYVHETTWCVEVNGVKIHLNKITKLPSVYSTSQVVEHYWYASACECCHDEATSIIPLPEEVVAKVEAFMKGELLK